MENQHPGMEEIDQLIRDIEGLVSRTQQMAGGEFAVHYSQALLNLEKVRLVRHQRISGEVTIKRV